MKVEFEIDDGLTPLSGICVLSCANDEGEPITAYGYYNEGRIVETIGLLTVALDEARWGYLQQERYEDE